MESEKWKPGIREETSDQHTDLHIRFYTHGNTTRECEDKKKNDFV